MLLELMVVVLYVLGGFLAWSMAIADGMYHLRRLWLLVVFWPFWAIAILVVGVCLAWRERRVS